VCRWSSPTPAEVEDTTGGSYLDEKQLEFCKAYLNEHHKTDVLLPFTHSFSELGTKSVKKNMWIGGSYSIVDAEVTDITSAAIHIEATVEEGGTSKKEQVVVPLDSDPVSGMARTYPTLPQIDPLKLNHASKKPIDNFCRRMSRLCNIVKAYKATGKLIQMGVQLGGDGVGKLHDDMYLNQVPHSKTIISCMALCSRKCLSRAHTSTIPWNDAGCHMTQTETELHRHFIHFSWRGANSPMIGRVAQ